MRTTLNCSMTMLFWLTRITLGIYKYENGEFTVCFAAPGKDRPKEFTTKSGTGEFMHVWKKK